MSKHDRPYIVMIVKGDYIGWLGVEAKSEGFPLLLRIRKTTPERAFGKLCVFTWKYSEDPLTRLPLDKFYSKIERFEKLVLDEIERRKLGLFVVSETGLGRIRYYIYTSCINDLVTFMHERIYPGESVEFASDDDETWSEYAHFRQLAD